MARVGYGGWEIPPLRGVVFRPEDLQNDPREPDPRLLQNVTPPGDFHEMWQAATRRNVLLHARLMRLRARLARRTALAAGLGFFAVIGWAHIVMSFGSGEGWW